MNRYMMIHRLRGPAFLLLVGVLALLNQANILSWGKSWPLFLILAGVLQLAERAILASGDGYPPAQYPPAPYPGAPFSAAPQPGATDPRTATGVPSYPGQPEAYIAPRQQDAVKKPEGGKS